MSGPVQRDAATLTGGFRNQEVQWRSKLEYRDDAGTEQREQWLSTNRGDWRMSEEHANVVALQLSRIQMISSTRIAMHASSKADWVSRIDRSTTIG